MNRQMYLMIERRMLEHMQDVAHDPNHIYRVLYASLDIMNTEPAADRDIVIAAALLHDIGRDRQAQNPELDHAVVGAQMAASFLVSIGWSAACAQHVADCVRTHRYRTNDVPQSIEARIIFDADKLDATGSMGIARTLLYCGQTGEPIYVLDDEGPLIADGDGSETNCFVQEFDWKLRHIYDKFLTARGHELAQKRRTVAIHFADELKREIESYHDHGASILGAALTD